MEKAETGVSRRTFIKGIGGAAAAAALLGSLKNATAEAIPTSVTFTKQELLEIYRRMQRIRSGELKLLEIYKKDAIGANKEGLRRTGHSSEGEEATCVGVAMAIKEGDYLTGTHRSHGYPIAMGMDLKPWMAELFGRSTGSNRGYAGSLHIAYPQRGVIGMSGIVGTGVSHAVGAARSAQVRGTKQVAVSTCGDAAMNSSGFNSSLNLAAIWNAPVVFVINNNQWELCVPARWEQSLVRAGRDLSARAAGYAIPGITVDGNDVFAVYKAATYCIENARAGKGPSLLECITYRHRSHNESWIKEKSTDTYLSHECLQYPYEDEKELQYWLKRCPIKRFEATVLDGMLKAEELAQVRKEVKAETEAAVDFAKTSPMLDPEVELKYVREVFGA